MVFRTDIRAHIAIISCCVFAVSFDYVARALAFLAYPVPHSRTHGVHIEHEARSRLHTESDDLKLVNERPEHASNTHQAPERICCIVARVQSNS